MRRSWVWFLAGGLIATGTYFALENGGLAQSILYQAIGAVSVLVMLLGIRMNRPERPSVWYLIAGGQACFVVADMIWYFYELVLHVESPFPSVADVLYLAGYPLIAVGLLLLIKSRSPRRDRAGLLDATIIATGIGVVVWVFLVVPFASDPGSTFLERAMSTAYPLMDILVIAVAARMMVTPGARTPSYRFLMAGLVSMLVADSIYGIIELRGSYFDGHPLDAGWLLSYIFFAVAILHPSMRRVSQPAREEEGKLSRQRLALLATASLLAPAVLAVQGVLGEHVDVAPIVLGSAGLFLLVVLRMAGLVREVQSNVDHLTIQGEQLRQAETRYRTLVEQTPAITYIQDTTGGESSVIYISPQVETVTGYSAEEWRSNSELWRRLLHPEDRERVLAEEAGKSEESGSFNSEYRLVARDGRVVWLQEVAVLMRNGEKEPRYWQGVMIDVSGFKRAADLERELGAEREMSERLRSLDELKNTFISAVSHELRTPLSVVLGTALTLERDEKRLSIEERTGLLSALARSARKLDVLLSDLLDLDRMARGIGELRLRPTDVGALVRQVVEQSEARGERFIHVDAESVVASVEPAKVERIVENLVSNAVRHTPPETLIWVAVRHEQDGVLIAVDDNGLGIPAEMRETIFEPFRQGTNVPAHAPGVGIGLSLVARFTELHNGRAWVEESPEGGASFRVWLPMGTAAAMPGYSHSMVAGGFELTS